MAIFERVSRVYWNETDAAQISHFSSYFKYCEETEEEFFNQRLGVRWRPGDIMFPRVHASCNYMAPLRAHDRYKVEITEITVGRKSMTFKYRIHNLELNQQAAECEITTVAIDPATFKSVEIPKELVDSLLKQGARLREANKE